MKIKQIILLTLAIFINIFIWYQSSLSAEISGERSGMITDIVVNVLDKVNIQTDRLTVGMIVRKLAHFTEFFFFGLLWSLFYLTFKKPKSAFIITFIQGSAVACIDEFIQRFVPGRAMQFTDVLIDVSGVVISLLFVSIILILKKNIAKRKKGYNE